MTNNTRYEEIVVCLYDGEYHLGVGALINSLAKFKFKGLVNIGYRGGNLPAWVSQLKPISDSYFNVTEEIAIHFKVVDTKMHLGYFKPFFIRDTFETFPTVKKVYYFDVDILIHAPWDMFSNWLQNGICLCLDSSFHFLHHTHPWRKHWRALANRDESLQNNTDQYFNSGFIGIENGNAEIIDRWINITNNFINNDGDVKRFVKNLHIPVRGDQDLLNAAITVSADIDCNIMGKEAMGFSLPPTLMLHAIGERKPWNSSFFIHLLSYGNKPSMSDKLFLTFCKYPIRVFSPFDYALKKIDLLIACFFGRFLS